GSHTVSVKDANNCPASNSITVNEPTVVNVGLTKSDAFCNGDSNGSLTATFSGGTGPYQVALDGGAFVAMASPHTFNGLAAGSHTVAVKDANNCPASKSITVNQPAVVNVGLSKSDALCHGAANGTVTTTFSGGTGPYQVAVDGGAFVAMTSPHTFNGLVPGSHTVSVKDATDGRPSRTITVNVPAGV